MQLVVLDHDLQVVLWSEGMAKAMSSFAPARGTRVKGLPFPSVEAQQKLIGELEVIMREEGAKAFSPVLALEAAVVSKPNVSLHLVTPLSVGASRDVLLSVTAIKMEPLSTATGASTGGSAAASSLSGVDNKEGCHLLIMGHESFDPGLASLRFGRDKTTPSWVMSDLASENSETKQHLRFGDNTTPSVEMSDLISDLTSENEASLPSVTMSGRVGTSSRMQQAQQQHFMWAVKEGHGGGRDGYERNSLRANDTSGGESESESEVESRSQQEGGSETRGAGTVSEDDTSWTWSLHEPYLASLSYGKVDTSSTVSDLTSFVENERWTHQASGDGGRLDERPIFGPASVDSEPATTRVDRAWRGSASVNSTQYSGATSSSSGGGASNGTGSGDGSAYAADGNDSDRSSVLMSRIASAHERVLMIQRGELGEEGRDVEGGESEGRGGDGGEGNDDTAAELVTEEEEEEAVAAGRGTRLEGRGTRGSSSTRAAGTEGRK